MVKKGRWNIKRICRCPTFYKHLQSFEVITQKGNNNG